MTFAITWIAPGGEAITLSTDTLAATQAWPDSSGWIGSWPSTDSTIKLVGTPDGLASTRASLVGRKSPGQYGVSGIDRQVDSRVVSTQALINADSFAETETFLAKLSGAMGAMPSTGEPVEFGWLRVSRPGKPAVQARAQPVDSPRVAYHRGSTLIVDLEFACPDPSWREVDTRTLLLQVGDGGWVAPWEAPWESVDFSDTADVDNPGHLPVPFIARLFGQQTFGSLTNVNTGESFTIEGEIAAGDYVEVDTGVESKSVTYVTSSGSRSNALGRWDFDSSRFFLLPVGASTLQWGAAETSGGSASVIWQPAYAGI